MYKEDDPSQLDDRDPEGYVFGAEDNAPIRWWIAPEHARPYYDFSAVHWPMPSIFDLDVGDRVLYIDGLEWNTRWVAYVRRKFEDGVWIYVEGDPQSKGGSWDVYNHHALCCTDNCPIRLQTLIVPVTKALYSIDEFHLRVFPIRHHLRLDQNFDAATGRWQSATKRKFYCSRSDQGYDDGNVLDMDWHAGRMAFARPDDYLKPCEDITDRVPKFIRSRRSQATLQMDLEKQVQQQLHDSGFFSECAVSEADTAMREFMAKAMLALAADEVDVADGSKRRESVAGCIAHGLEPELKALRTSHPS